MINYEKKIALHVLKAYNNGNQSFGIKKIDKKYDSYEDRDLIQKINSAAEKLEEKGFVEIIYIERTNYIKKILISKEKDKIEQLANKYRMKTKETFCEQVQNILKKYENSEFDEIRTFVDNQKTILQDGKSVKFTQNQSVDLLEDVLMAWTTILSQKEYIKLRNLSSKIFEDSKKLAKIVRSLWPVISNSYDDIEGSDVEKQEHFLNEHNIYKNSIYVMIKGKGVIYFQNGERITLTDYLGPTQFSKEYVDKMTRIETKQILTIENLTTFEDFNMNEFDGIVLYLGGFSNKVNVSFIKKANMPIKHFGDIDANGFKILYNLKEQLEQPVDAYMMDMNTILKCEDRGTSMDDEKFKHNRVKLQTMMSDEKYTKEERELFEYLLKIDKIFEQEAISDLIC